MGVPFLASAKDKLATPSPSVTVSGTSVTMSWGAISNAASYNVVFEGGSISAAPNTTSTSVTRTNVAPGNYCAKVMANAATGPGSLYNNSDFSTCVSFTIAAQVVCNTPTVRNMEYEGQVLFLALIISY